MADHSSDTHDLTDLKTLLLKPEHGKLKAIENRLDNPMIRAGEISDALPDAISLSVTRSDKLSRVIQPVIDQSIKTSVQKNPRALADAIFPALGPGIRKSITSTIMGMLQSMNQVLNHSFSFKGIKWRFEAFKTGKSFAEVVLLNTLVFQIEQIFLIHNQSGVVLEHVMAENAIIQDPDLVSGMLTAIRDFVKDSFDTGTDDELETLRIGSDRSVWIEQGEHALIAAVIRGTPPLDLRTRYRELLEEIHIKSGEALETFEGDPSPFAIFRESLKDCLLSKAKSDKKKISPLLFLIIAAVLGGLIFFIYSTVQTRQMLAGYLDRLNSQEGIIVLSHEKKDNRYYISGLKDNLAVDPETLLEPALKERMKFGYNFEPYVAVTPNLVLRRAKQILLPPPEVKLFYEDGSLSAAGTAKISWVNKFIHLAPALPGVTRIKHDQLITDEKKQLESAIKELSAIRLYFEKDSSRLVDEQQEKLSAILETIQRIQRLEKYLNTSIPIIIFGHTDSYGSERRNLRLSRDRAEKIFNHLVLKGVDPSFISVSGIGTQLPLADETSQEDRAINRAVSFKAQIDTK